MNLLHHELLEFKSSRHLYFLMLKSYLENGFAFILILIHRTKQLIQCSGHASRIIGLPNHGIRFSTSSCTISKDCGIETLKIPPTLSKFSVKRLLYCFIKCLIWSDISTYIVTWRTESTKGLVVRKYTSSWRWNKYWECFQ